MRTELPMPRVRASWRRAKRSTRASWPRSGRCPASPPRATSASCRCRVPRRHLAGRGATAIRPPRRRAPRRTTSPPSLRHARLLPGDGHPAQARPRHQRGRHAATASSSPSSASRSSGATGRTQDPHRPALHLRLRGARSRRRRRRRPIPRPGARERAAGVPVVAAGRRRRDHVLRAEGARGADDRRRRRRSRRPSAAIVRGADPALPITERADADRDGRSRHRVACGPGARARRVRRDRVRARRPSAFTACCRSRSRSARRRSASAWRSARSRATSCRWCCGADAARGGRRRAGHGARLRAGRSMEALLAGVKPADACTLAAAVGLALAMTVVGSVAPTLRALRVDPITALKTE